MEPNCARFPDELVFAAKFPFKKAQHRKKKGHKMMSKYIHHIYASAFRIRLLLYDNSVIEHFAEKIEDTAKDKSEIERLQLF
eukprot:IDg18534t1